MYNPDFCELARKYCLLGAANEELSDFFGVTRRTIDNWIANHPDFEPAVKDSRQPAPADMARQGRTAG